MTSAPLANHLSMLEAGRDNALLGLSLGDECLKRSDVIAAVLLDESLNALHEGIAIAERDAHAQLAKQSTVFITRVERKLPDPS